MLAVFVQRGGTNTVQLSPRQGRLQQVGGIHGAFRRTGADQGMQFVNEQDDFAFRCLDIRQDSFQALLELAAKLGTCDQGAEIKHQQAFVLKAFGHVAIHDADCQAFDNRRLAHARLTDQHRIVLGPP